jgi:hypothetical protein
MSILLCSYLHLSQDYALKKDLFLDRKSKVFDLIYKPAYVLLVKEEDPSVLRHDYLS